MLKERGFQFNRERRLHMETIGMEFIENIYKGMKDEYLSYQNVIDLRPTTD